MAFESSIGGVLVLRESPKRPARPGRRKLTHRFEEGGTVAGTCTLGVESRIARRMSPEKMGKSFGQIVHAKQQ